MAKQSGKANKSRIVKNVDNNKNGDKNRKANKLRIVIHANLELRKHPEKQTDREL